MNTLNVGIIGCGNISGIYLQNIPAYRGLTLRACADMQAEIAQAQASRHGIEALYGRSAPGQRRHRSRGQPHRARPPISASRSRR